MTYRVFSICVLTLVSTFTISPAGETKDVKAVVQELDPAVGTITVIVEEGVPRLNQVKTFNLQKPDIPITTAEGKKLKLADIPAEQRIYLQMAGEDVSAIRLAPPTFFGTLSKLNLKDQTVVVTSKMGVTKTFTIPSNAKIYDHFQLATLQNLKPGNPVRLSLSEDLKTVIELKTAKSLMPAAHLIKAVGIVIDINHDKRTMQFLVTVSAGDHSVLRDLSFARDANFSLMYHFKHFREIPLEEVRKGVKAHIWTDATTKKVVHLEAEMPTLGQRAVKSFDPERRQLILQDADGEKSLTLSPTAKVLVKGQPGTLADIQAKAQVSCGLSPSRQLVEVIYIFK